MRWTETILVLTGLWIAFAPSGWGWDAACDQLGEIALLRFFLGFSILLMVGLIFEKNRMRGHMRELVDGLNRMLYGKDYARDREAVDLLMQAATGSNQDIVKKAVRSLEKITGQRFGRDIEAWQAWWLTSRESFKIKGRQGGGRSASGG
jgi:hypothetical protein